jgi:serine/threonine protein kinase
VSKGTLPLEQVLKYATQIADALDRAHRSDVCHRDVKPADIMLTRDGIKVLDFGLAKTAPRLRPDDVTGMAAALTSEGTILGTPQYMAPEQYEGKEADERSDIFAFGCVVYEMVTGKRCFDGKTKASLIAAVLGGEPAPMSALVPVTPAALERLVKRCIEKDPEDRYQSMRDVVLELRSIATGATEAQVGPAATRRGRVAWVAAGLFALAAAALAFVHFRETPPETPLLRYTIEPPEKTTFGGAPELSPDGRHVAFWADGKLWVRALDSLAAQPLNGTELGAAPFWSPDSKSLGSFPPARSGGSTSPEGRRWL